MSKLKTVAEILVDVLTDAGVKHCYGIVGDTLNHVTESIHQSKIEWIHMRHEEAGAFAAGAEAFVTENLTACAGSCGPGSLHFINGLYEAQRNNAPVILIASQLNTENLGTGFPQEVDFLDVYKSCSVFCAQVTDATQAQRIFTQAAQAAINKKGVAVIILPANISKQEVKTNPAIKIWAPNPVIRPNDHELNKIVELINQGKKITIYAGIGAKDAREELIKLASLLKAPIVHTSRAKDFIQYDNPYDIGMNGMFGTKSGYDAIQQCDTLFLLGCGFAWSQFYPSNGTIIQIDHDATQLGLRHPISYGAVGDIKATLNALNPLIKGRQDRSFLDEHVELYKKSVSKWDKKAKPEKNKLIHPQYLFELVNKYAHDDALFTADVGSAMVWSTRHLQTNTKRRLLNSLKHGTMANAMPQALGLQKAFPQQQVISFSGDGGLAMLLGDLLTAKQENLPIKVVILNNGSLNFVELEQKGEGLVNRYTDLNNQDFAKMALGMGFWAQNVNDSNELDQLIQQFLTVDEPALLNVFTSPNELIMPPVTSFDNVKNMSLYSAKAILEGKGSDVWGLIKDNL